MVHEAQRCCKILNVLGSRKHRHAGNLSIFKFPKQKHVGNFRAGRFTTHTNAGNLWNFRRVYPNCRTSTECSSSQSNIEIQHVRPMQPRCSLIWCLWFCFWCVLRPEGFGGRVIDYGNGFGTNRFRTASLIARSEWLYKQIGTGHMGSAEEGVSPDFSQFPWNPVRIRLKSGEDVLSEGTGRTLAGSKKYLPSAKTCFQNEVR